MASVAAAVSNGRASDLLRGSGGLSGTPLQLKSLGICRITTPVGRRTGSGFALSAKLRKVKKHDYPWPADPDPNVKGGVLTHLSHFKPLKEKQKPVTLEFEKPLVDLQKKIIEVQKMANETGLDFTDQIVLLESKYQQALKDLYTHLSAIQRVNIARHPNRPTFLDHVFSITDKFVELHGDRSGYDDPAIVTGIGTINGERYMFMGHQKGRNTKENIQRNFGMPTPHGYRKALRMMYYAERHGFPIVTFIDTPGAFADLKSEELGQGEAIAHNLRTMFGLKVPILSIVIGEGGSGGALAIGCANKLLMLENAVFYVASPEACAAILWKSAKASPQAAEKLKITAAELCKLQIADGIIPEPLGGAHGDPSWTSQQIKLAVVESMKELKKMNTEKLMRHRLLKFRKIGGFQEGIPIDPQRKVNMKKKEEPMTPDKELEEELENLKQQILKVKETSAESSDTELDEMIGKRERELENEISEAIKGMDLDEEVVAVREKILKLKYQDLDVDPATGEQAAQLCRLITKGLPSAPNYSSLQDKYQMLKDLIGKKQEQRIVSFKQELDEKAKDVFGRSDIKKMIEALQADLNYSGATTVEDIDQGLKEKILKVKKLVQAEMANALTSMGLEVVTVANSKASATKFIQLNEKICSQIEDAMYAADVKRMIQKLKVLVAEAGETPNKELSEWIKATVEQIRTKVFELINTSELRAEYEELMGEIDAADASLDGYGAMGNGVPGEGYTGNGDSGVNVNVGGRHGLPIGGP
ncbi:hypothetical protein MLD38_032616 [Melastoma candidum]|uniref:Uncharacterized protein n=1 Tax=Melastoma candidum TaxID=119954 RepID=A0ACB9M6E6_9MYRT|nr:hypothetical protein MLD38_032616 [Melastoma candidum]